MTRRSDWDHFPKFIEYVVMAAIALVLVFIVVEEIAIIEHWSHEWIVRLVFIGFAFDIFFSLEFVGRSAISARHGHFWYYIRAQRGWVDFITSWPLLLLVSGPAVVIILADDWSESSLLGYMAILKTAKVIRVTRILRLIRVIKLFGKIQNTESMMTNRHVGIISTMMVVALIVVFFISQFVGYLHVGDRGEYIDRKITALTHLFESSSSASGGPNEAWLVSYISENPFYKDVIRLHSPAGKELYVSKDLEELEWTAYKAGALVPLGDSGYKVELSYHRADSEHSKMNLFLLTAIIFIILTMMLLYTRIFAQQIADPIYIMDKGLRQWDYNLEVRVDQDHVYDEISQLAIVYNNRWMTLKNQIRAYRRAKDGGGGEKSSLSLDDIF